MYNSMAFRVKGTGEYLTALCQAVLRKGARIGHRRWATTRHRTGHRANVARGRHRSGLRHFITSCGSAELASKRSNRTDNSVPTARNGWPHSARAVGIRYHRPARMPARVVGWQYLRVSSNTNSTLRERLGSSRAGLFSTLTQLLEFERVGSGRVSSIRTDGDRVRVQGFPHLVA